MQNHKYIVIDKINDTHEDEPDQSDTKENEDKDDTKRP